MDAWFEKNANVRGWIERVVYTFATLLIVYFGRVAYQEEHSITFSVLLVIFAIPTLFLVRRIAKKF